MNNKSLLSELLLEKSKESLLEFLTEKSSDIIWVLDSDLIIRYVSHSFSNLSGTAPSSHIAKPFSSLITSVSVENIKHVFANQQYLETFENLKITYLSNNGPIAAASLHGKLIKDDAGKFLGAVCISTTREVRKQIEIPRLENARLNIEANQFKSIILGNVGHELRTPLNAIMGFASILSSELVQPANKEMIGYIKESASKLNTTINSIVTLSALESNQLQVRYQLVDLSELISNVYQSFEQTVKVKNLNYEFNYNLDTQAIYSDEYILSFVFYYLIDNAVKFTHTGKVGVEVCNGIHKGHKYTVVKVFDTGVGIESHKLESIFEPFRQGSEGITRNYEGIGLGLTVAKKLISILGGHIELQSIVGQGSIFSVYIPNKSKITPNADNVSIF